MKRAFVNYFIVVIAVVFCCSCGKKISSVNEFNSFINDAKNGLKISKSVNGVTLSVIYTPPEYLTLKEMESNNYKGKEKYDSLLANNKASASFLMIFGPDESKENKDDIMYKGLKNFKEYVERAMTLNFDLEQLVTLNTGSNNYLPVLSSLENTYGLSKDRKVNIVFSSIKGQKKLSEETKYDFVYEDETYDIGTLHFEFDKKEIEKNLPEIIFQ